MDESQASPGGVNLTPSQPMPSFDQFPDSNFSQSIENCEDDMIVDSQSTQRPIGTQAQETQGFQFDISQSQTFGFDSLIREQDASQMTDSFEPSQDGGYQKYTPLKERFIQAPPSTVDTVQLNLSQVEATQHDSPLLQRKGRLVRRNLPTIDSDEQAEVAGQGPSTQPMAVGESEDDDDAFGAVADAFGLMKDGAEKEHKTKKLEAYNKKKSKAKDMVEDQAEESEDEYAGLGGADGEDSDDESTASVKDMIDDDHKSNLVDDTKLAAFYAYVSTTRTWYGTSTDRSAPQ